MNDLDFPRINGALSWKPLAEYKPGCRGLSLRFRIGNRSGRGDYRRSLRVCAAGQETCGKAHPDRDWL